MSEKQNEAIQKAFEKGQEDWRAGKGIDENYYPLAATDYYDTWIQGWEEEDEIQRK